VLHAVNDTAEHANCNRERSALMRHAIGRFFLLPHKRLQCRPLAGRVISGFRVVRGPPLAVSTAKPLTLFGKGRLGLMRQQFAWVILVFLAALSSGCKSSRTPEVPTAFHGVWTTSHPRYTERHFEIDGQNFIIGIGAERTLSHALLGIESKDARGKVQYTLYYSEVGLETPFSFYFDVASRVIRLAHQENIEWTRKES
jgi:hypothetical protein